MNIYDFDGTLYAGDSTVDFLKFAIKKHPTLICFLPGMGLAAVKHYVFKSMDKTAMKQVFYRIFTGFDAEGLLEEFWDTHVQNIFPWYPGRQHKDDDILISASPEFLLKPICARLGIRHLIASRVDSRTGLYTGKNCWGPEKPIRLREEMGIIRCDSFYSDSYSDQPMAEISNNAFMVEKDGTITSWIFK
ncbi:MAG: HAD-IB family phosphatase [Faecousia sp.]